MLDEKSEKTLDRLKMTEAELDQLIEDCFDSGWSLSTFEVKGCYYMAPSDKRLDWCAEWFHYKNKLIPHWINRPYEEVSK